MDSADSLVNSRRDRFGGLVEGRLLGVRRRFLLDLYGISISEGTETGGRTVSRTVTDTLAVSVRHDDGDLIEWFNRWA